MPEDLNSKSSVSLASWRDVLSNFKRRDAYNLVLHGVKRTVF